MTISIMHVDKSLITSAAKRTFTVIFSRFSYSDKDKMHTDPTNAMLSKMTYVM